MIYIELFLTFAMIGFTSFGGMSMIPLINQQMVSHNWMSIGEVADIVAIAEMTPGPLGLNCATFAGTRTAGTLGAAAASLGVLAPTLTTTLLVGMFMARFKQSHIMGDVLYGIRPVCIGMITAVILQQIMENYAGQVLGISPGALCSGLVAAYLLIVRKWEVPPVIGISALIGLLLCR